MSDKEKDTVTEKVKVLAVNEDDQRMVVENNDGTRGIVMPLKEGVPIRPGADLVTCRPTDDPYVMEMTREYSTSKGPAKVSNPSYRKNWDAVFGKRKSNKEYLN